MEHTLTSTDWNDLFTDRPARKHLSFLRKEDPKEAIALFTFILGEGFENDRDRFELMRAVLLTRSGIS